MKAIRQLRCPNAVHAAAATAPFMAAQAAYQLLTDPGRRSVTYRCPECRVRVTILESAAEVD